MLTRISSTEQLHSVINAIQAANPNCRLVFRGQRRDIAPLPSAQRQINDPAYRRAQSIFHSSWDQASSYLLPGNTASDSPFQRLLASMALLQHYGFRSWFVDITSDPEIAAWFAIHNYVSGQILVSPRPIYSGSGPSPYLTDHALAVVSTAHYQRCADDDGFLFVFQVPISTQNPFCLTEVLSSSALRVHRQKAGALIAPLDGQQLSSSLRAMFIIDKKIVLPEHLNARWLFPPPADDEVYKRLLRVPYVVDEDNLDEKPLLGRPALINLPLYIYDDHPDLDSLSHIRVLTGFYGPGNINEPDRTQVILPLSQFPKISYTTYVKPPNEFLPPDATNVSLRIRQSPRKPLDFSVWKSRRMWLVYPIHQMLVTFMYREAVYPLFRGLFVDIDDENNVRLTPIEETVNPNQLVTVDFNPGDEIGFRDDFCFLTERLESGEATLKRVGWELHYEWKGWEDRQHEDPLQEFRELFS